MNNRNLKISVGGGIHKENIFEKLVSLENLFLAWERFKRGKTSKADVQKFELHLEDNLFSLREQLTNGAYRHDPYESFYVRDPKLRHIHKASVRDRVVHQAVMNVLEPVFERVFIFDSYASRKEKGTHRAVSRLRKFAWRLSRNNTRTVWVLQCDIKKFFDSVDHGILFRLLEKRIYDRGALRLCATIIQSFNGNTGKGLPLGNVTSQLFANIYLNELDQFIKRKLRVKFYLRYADDFVLLNHDRAELESIIPLLGQFLRNELSLALHPQKVSIKTWHQGIDFLGYVSFPHHAILRTKTKRRMFTRIYAEKSKEAFISYLGLTAHCRSRNVRLEMVRQLIGGPK